MKRGDRIRLAQDYREPEFGFEYRRGQTGTVINPKYGGGDEALVEWDGYEEEREADRRLRQQHGEGYNVLVFRHTVPRDLLEVT